MNKNIINTKKNHQQTVLLYRYVFNSRIPTLAVFLLLLSFCLQPIERAYGAETEQVDVTATALTTSTPILNESNFF